MTPLQKVVFRLSEVRARLNEISGLEGDAFTAEIRTEAGGLQTEYADLEIKHRAALVAEGDDRTTRRWPVWTARRRSGRARAIAPRSTLGRLPHTGERGHWPGGTGGGTERGA